MTYTLIKDVIDLIQQFEGENKETRNFDNSIIGFKNWISATNKDNVIEPNWEGKEKGRTPESVINTLIVHMNRYAKSYSKSAIIGSDFSTQEDFIYLINLKAFGEMTKMDLIKKNVHEKSVGMQIINRLIGQGWVTQTTSETDRRSKVLKMTPKGFQILEQQMYKIKQATQIVTGDLLYKEKMELIRLLSKLDKFHLHIYNKNIEPEKLLKVAFKKEDLE